MALWKGNPATKAFYDNIGWQPEDNGVLGDWNRFVSADGPVQRALDLERRRRIANLVTPGLEIIELACGANPAVFLASNCKNYTAVDFSSAGLEVAAQRLKEANRPFRTIEADITRLPLDDESFDIVYSAQAIYHIDRADGQAAAFSEAMRVLRSGGRAIFVMANPFPVLDPYRTVRRALAMTPGVGAILARLRSKPPLPYLPMPLGWMRKQLSKWGDVTITGYAVCSVDFSRRVSETSVIGSRVWHAISWLETRHPDWVARLGNYVIIVADRRSVSQCTS